MGLSNLSGCPIKECLEDNKVAKDEGNDVFCDRPKSPFQKNQLILLAKSLKTTFHLNVDSFHHKTNVISV